MKRALCLTMAAIMAAMLAACGTPAAAEALTAEPAAEPTAEPVVVFTDPALEAKAREAMGKPRAISHSPKPRL